MSKDLADPNRTDKIGTDFYSGGNQTGCLGSPDLSDVKVPEKYLTIQEAMKARDLGFNAKSSGYFYLDGHDKEHFVEGPYKYGGNDNNINTKFNPGTTGHDFISAPTKQEFYDWIGMVKKFESEVRDSGPSGFLDGPY